MDKSDPEPPPEPDLAEKAQVSKRQRQNRLEAAQILELVRAYLAGASVQELTGQFQIHRTTVLAHLERQGVPRRPNISKLSEADVVEASRLYLAGQSTLQLGRHFGVDAETVRKALHRARVRLRASGNSNTAPSR